MSGWDNVAAYLAGLLLGWGAASLVQGKITIGVVSLLAAVPWLLSVRAQNRRDGREGVSEATGDPSARQEGEHPH